MLTDKINQEKLRTSYFYSDCCKHSYLTLHAHVFLPHALGYSSTRFFFNLKCCWAYETTGNGNHGVSFVNICEKIIRKSYGSHFSRNHATGNYISAKSADSYYWMRPAPNQFPRAREIEMPQENT